MSRYLLDAEALKKKSGLDFITVYGCYSHSGHSSTLESAWTDEKAAQKEATVKGQMVISKPALCFLDGTFLVFHSIEHVPVLNENLDAFREKAKQEALAKLTQADKEILGFA